MEFIKDYNGNEVRVGDEIIYITSSGHVPQVNHGTVTEFRDVDRPSYQNDISFAYAYPYGCKIRVKTPKNSSWSRDWALLERAPIFKKGLPL